MIRIFGDLAGLRAVLTLCLVLLAFICGWIVGGNGNGNGMGEADGEVATMASAQEVEEMRSLIEAGKEAPLVEELQDVAVGPPAPPVSGERTINGATSLTRNIRATPAPEC